MSGKQSIWTLILLLAAAIATPGQDVARRAISKPMPHYPEIARRMNLVGTVKVEALVGPDGKVKRVEVKGGHPVLVGVTVDAVKEWRYEPAKSETVVSLSFDFSPPN